MIKSFLAFQKTSSPNLEIISGIWYERVRMYHNQYLGKWSSYIPIETLIGNNKRNTRFQILQLQKLYSWSYKEFRRRQEKPICGVTHVYVQEGVSCIALKQSTKQFAWLIGIFLEWVTRTNTGTNAQKSLITVFQNYILLFQFHRMYCIDFFLKNHYFFKNTGI